MNVPQGTIRSLKLLVGTLIPIMGVAVAVYLLFTTTRHSQLVERDYRALLTIAKQTQDRLEGLREALGTEHRSRQPKQSQSEPLPLPEAPWIKSVARVKVTTSPASLGGTRMAVVQAPDGRSLEVYVAYERECDELVNPHALGHCRVPSPRCVTAWGPGGETLATCSRFSLDRILAETIPDDIFFDVIAVTIGDSVVVVRSSIPADVGSELHDALQGKAVDVDRASLAPEVARAQKAIQSRSVPAFTVHGDPFLRFSLPIAVPAAVQHATGKLADTPLQIHGMVREASFRQKVRRISDLWIVALLLVLVFAVLAWPLLKLWYMGSSERLNGLDVRILVLTMVLATGVLAVALLEIPRHKALSKSFDQQLGAFATRVSDTLHADVEAAILVARSAVSSTPKPLQYWDFERVVVINDQAGASRAWEPKRSEDGTWSLAAPTPVPRLKVDERKYYADARAGRVWKFPVAGIKEVPVIGEVVRSKISGDPTLVLAMPIDGSNAEGLSVDAKETVLLIAMRVTKLLQAWTPYGFGFAVLDPTGRVVLHSDARRVLVENFIDECEQDPRLRAALRAPGTAPMDVECSGVFQRLVARSIPNIPSWTLVAFRDHRLADKLTDEVEASWAFLYLMYVAGLLAAMLVAQIVHEGYRAEWAWPDRRFPRLYAPAALRLLATAVVLHYAVQQQTGFSRLGFLYAAMAATISALALSLTGARDETKPGNPKVETPPDIAVAMALLCVAGVALLVFTIAARDWLGLTGILALGWMWRTRHDDEARAASPAAPPSEGRFRRDYVAMLTALLLVVAVLPAVALYRDARVQAMTELLTFGRWHLSRTGTDRTERWQRQLQDPNGALFPAAWTCWSDTDLLGSSDAAHRDERRSLAQFAVARLPMFGAPIPELRALADGGAARRGRPSSVCDTINAADAKPALRWRWWFICIGFAVAAAVLVYSVVWSIARLVFLLDIDRFDQKGTPGTLPPGTLNAWIYGSRKGFDAALHADPPPETIDLRIPTTVEALESRAVEVAADESTTAVQIDHLETILDNPQLHAALLSVLEKLVHAHKKTVILTAEVDPINWAAARMLEAACDRAAGSSDDASAAAKKAEDDASALVARWSQLLATFVRARYQLPPSETLQGEELETAKVLEARYPTLASDPKTTPAKTPDETDELFEARHWQIWRQCTRAEKLTLRQLAEEGFINPNAIAVTRRLCDRLLIRRDPAFSLLTPAFARFVLRAEMPETIAAWQAAGAQSAWARLRGPLMIMATIAAVYFVVAEPDAMNWSIALATGVAAAIPAVLKLFSMFGEQRFGAGGR